MSARKLETNNASAQAVTLETRQTQLTLSREAVAISKSGVEFRSAEPFPLWTEMTVTLECPPEGRVNCSGVVVACNGNRHSGYCVAMLFTGLSKQSEARLNALSYV